LMSPPISTEDGPEFTDVAVEGPRAAQGHAVISIMEIDIPQDRNGFHSGARFHLDFDI